jgi:hypothetical protein
MKKSRKPAKPVTAEAIACLADQGRDISGFFRGEGRMVSLFQRVSARLSQSDSLRVLDLLENPPSPNAKLLAAARALSKR